MLIFTGFLLMILMFAFVGGWGGSYIRFFIDVPSLLIILVPLLFFLCVTKSGNIINGYIGSSFKKNYEYSKAELERIAAAIKNTIRFTLAMGGFGFVAGLVAILAWFQMEKLNSLGANLAVSLLTVIYAIAISFFVFFPVQAWAENKIKTGA